MFSVHTPSPQQPKGKGAAEALPCAGEPLTALQDQGSTESPLPALLAAGGVPDTPSPPGCPQGTTPLLSSKIQVSSSITEHHSPPSFLGFPQAEPVALQGAHPSLTYPTSEIRVLQLIRKYLHYTTVRPHFSPSYPVFFLKYTIR